MTVGWTDEAREAAVRAPGRVAAGTAVRLLREVEVDRILDALTPHVEAMVREARAEALREAAEAKWAILAEHKLAWARQIYPAEAALPEGVEWILGLRQGLDRAVQALAAVHSDHPDYREEWA